MHRNRYQHYRKILQLLLSSFVFACFAVPVLACELSGEMQFNEVAQGVYVHAGVQEDMDAGNCGDIANIGFIVGDASVAVIDPGGSPAVGLGLFKAIASVTRLPISHVVITHFHPDHFFGTAKMGKEVVIVAHKNYARALAQRGQFYLDRYTTLFSPSDAKQLAQSGIQVERHELIDLGNRELRLVAYKTAHTDNDLTIFDVESGVLWAGDLLFHERIPTLDGSVNGWLDVMDELAEIGSKMVIPGHGPAGRWEAIAPKQRHYLELLRNEVREVIAANGRLADAVETVGFDERKKWLLFNDFHRGNVTKAFTELEWE